MANACVICGQVHYCSQQDDWCAQQRSYLRSYRRKKKPAAAKFVSTTELTETNKKRMGK
jgi:hypothetical protein